MENVEVIFEDEKVMVINKPSGLVVHGDGRNEEETLADWVLGKYPEMKGVGESWRTDSGEVIPRPGIVHRLDRDTSGVMVLAKTQESFECLKKQFQERKIQKTYRAFVYGILKEKKGRIEKEIGKSKGDFRKWSAEFGARGKMREAVTEYEVLREGEFDGEEISELLVSPKSGRTHQIRVHLKSIGHSIVCDKLYAPKKPCLGFVRLALHAFSIQFTSPDGKLMKFEAPLPQDFLVVQKRFSDRLSQ